MIKTGLGIDAHGFTAGSGITLGGVSIPCDRSLAGHSDGDVVIHAIVDALLGTAAQGDIGTHFPSSDPQWRGASSRIFLRRAREIVVGSGGEISHVDCTVILQEPVLAPHIPEMRRLIAEDLAIDTHQVSIKATTTDHLGFTGRKEGVAAVAVATISLQDGLK
jgi:2-C-methyl-D-erythritol 4-phosphate cytidylyltransferase/2-C-methyl-D-erythritol 2,4-cyclodiphosphate synthase